MIHRMFRSLDDPPKLVGFTIKQWAVLISGAGSLVGVIHLTHVPTKPAITICVFVIGLPAALTYVSESGGLQLSVLLRAMWRWRWSTRVRWAASPTEKPVPGLMVLAPEENSEQECPVSLPDDGIDGMNLWERWG